jgi:hypothetical protein
VTIKNKENRISKERSELTVNQCQSDRMENHIKGGRLTKANINYRGYNKYLKINGHLVIKIDYDKYLKDKSWDGLKGYVTNTKLSDTEVMENYRNLWHIESFPDVKNRPSHKTNLS